MAGSPGLRPPNTAPLPLQVEDHFEAPIGFRHPGYPPTGSTLFFFRRVDSAGNNGPRGVHHRTALLACQIVANNTFGGRLYADREGRREVELALEDVLTGNEYYFIIGRDPTLWYPVVPSFNDWRFPHHQVEFKPSGWSTRFDKSMDRCALTNHVSAVEAGHVVPEKEGVWFWRERMYVYCLGTGLDFPPNDSLQNLIPLRADIRRCYDARMFAIVPKAERFGAEDKDFGESTYAVHALFESSREFRELYHNVTLQSKHLQHIPPGYHLARFAWAILHELRPFFLVGFPHNVARVGAGGTCEVEELSGSALFELYGEDEEDNEGDEEGYCGED